MLSWDLFNVCNENPRFAFEAMCRMLFRNMFLASDAILSSNPNNPGVEVEPIMNREKTRRISFQAKYFDNFPDYSQILYSSQKTITHYVGRIDCVYLFCNRPLTLSAQGFINAKKILASNNIDLVAICGDEILDQVIKYPLIEHTFFATPQITKDWIKEQFNMSLGRLGNRYNKQFNIETETQRKFDLFLSNEASADILNEIKSECVRKLKRYSDSYGEGQLLANTLQTEVEKLPPANLIDLSYVNEWSNIIIEKCSRHIDNAKKRIQELQLQISNEQDRTKRALLSRDAAHLSNILETLDGLNIDQNTQALMTAKICIVTGDAGMGKTQLLATASQNCLLRDEMTLLLLGSSFLNRDPIGKQITSILDLDCSFKALLDKMEGIAEQEDKYSYIFIDALNECRDNEIWKNTIGQLFQQISTYKRIKLAISIRTGYDRFLFSDQLNCFIDSGIAIKLHHKGFWNNSISALRDFMNFYKIPFLPNYALSHEMTNPLFLTLFCKYYNNETIEIKKLFDRMITQADNEIKIAIGKDIDQPLLNKFIADFVEVRIQKGHLAVSYDDLLSLRFWNKYGLESEKIVFLDTLIKSGLFLKDLIKEDEYVLFAYQKMDDYLCATYLMKKYSNRDTLIKYIVTDLLGIKEGEIWNNNKIDIAIEICKMYAENTGEEIFDAIACNLTNQYDLRSFSELYLHSFSWRSCSSIRKEAFLSFVRKYSLNAPEVWNVMIENSMKEYHPLNINLLHEILTSKKIAVRDYLWTTYINSISNEENRLYQLLIYFEKGNSFENISDNITEKFLILVTWLFTTTNRHLRDKATKVAVELLKTNFQLCKKLLIRFAAIDDPYVVQRLYCAVYGACLKKADFNKEDFTNLAQHIYDSVFLQSSVYPDILVRDYARHIIERWIYENGGESNRINIAKIRPPYKSEPIPLIEPLNYCNKINNRSGIALIDLSMRVDHQDCPGMSGDFGKYVFQSALSNFEDVDIVNLYHYAMQYILNTLGYDDETLGEEDWFFNNHRPLTSQHPIKERIGKKYQWIAFYHILARITDHYELIDYNKGTAQYNGPWEPYVRDIDPTINQTIAYTTSLPVFKNSEIDKKDFLHQYPIQQTNIDEWFNEKATFHCTLPERLILNDAAGKEWIVLLRYEDNRIEPSNEVKNAFNYSQGTQIIWAHAYGLFIKRSEKAVLVDNLKEQLSSGIEIHAPDGPDVYQLFSREYPWAPGVPDILNTCWRDVEIRTGDGHVVEYPNPIFLFRNNYGIDEEYWENEEEKFNETTSRIIYDTKKIGSFLPTHIYVLHEEQSDTSNTENASFYIPCTELLESLNLTQQKDDGLFMSPSGELVAFDPSLNHGFSGLVIRKDYLELFLQDKQYDLIWYCIGEKQFIYGFAHQTWMTLRSIFSLENGRVLGEWDYCHVNKSNNNSSTKS